MSITVTILVSSLGALLLGAAVLAAERILPTPRPGEEPDALRLAFRTSGWVLILTSLVLASFRLIGGVMGVLGLVVLGMVVQRSRRAQWLSLLWTLAVAADRGLPLVPAIEALATEEGWAGGWRARRVAALLRAGWPLPDALQQVRGTVPRESLVAIRVGHETGAVGPALRQTLERLESGVRVWGDLGDRFVYLGVLFGMAILTAGFLLTRVVPAFQRILLEFNVVVPRISQVVFDLSGVMAQYWYLTAPLHLLALALIGYGIFRYCGWLEWDLPGLGFAFRRLHAANLLDCLALVAHRDQPMTRTLALLAGAYPRRAIRRRLGKVLADLEAGADWCESFWRRGLIGRAEYTVLQAAQRVGNLPWAISRMA
ncbi:MAG: type II secretion system F family protein, partial [Thermoguttaceae bacterium]|nr:type II secretion system F family protein [Thermoguttaceae bacterium]